MKTKKILGTAAVSAALLGLAACGSTGSDATTSKPVSTSGNITFLTTAGDDLMTVLNAAKTQYEEENEGWTVTITNGYSYDTLKTKITSDLTAGAQPCLAVCYGDHVANYLKTGKVLNFEPFINGTAQAEDAADALTDADKTDLSAYYDEGTVFAQEGRYTMPLSKSTDAVYINETVCKPYMEKLGINPTDPAKWTWTDFWKLGEALKADYPNSTPIGFDSEANMAITYLEEVAGMNNGTKYYTDSTQSGKNKILFNNDKTKEFFSMCYDEYFGSESTSAGILTTKGVSGSYTSSLFTKYDKTTTDPATYEGSFISIGSTGGASHQMPSNEDAFEVSLACMPNIDGTTNSLRMISQGPSLVMFDQNDAGLEAATWKFVKLLLSTDVQKAYGLASGGYAPVRASALEAVLADSTCTNVNKLCLNMMQTMKKYFYTSDCFDGSAVARTQLGDALINLLKSTSTASKADKISSVLDDAEDEARYYAKD